MEIINGTKQKQNPTDYHQACKRCGRLFYFGRNSNKKTVICPHCGVKH